jgi:hypothetical protein
VCGSLPCSVPAAAYLGEVTRLARLDSGGELTALIDLDILAERIQSQCGRPTLDKSLKCLPAPTDLIANHKVRQLVIESNQNFLCNSNSC